MTQKTLTRRKNIFLSLTTEAFPDDLIEELQSTYTSLQTKQKNLILYKQNIARMHVAFSNLVHARNQYARENGFDNYFLYKLEEYGVPPSLFKKWTLDFGQKRAEHVQKLLTPYIPDQLPIGFWTEYNIPDISRLYEDITIPSREAIYEQLIQNDNEYSRYTSRIIHKEHDSFIPIAEYDLRSKKAIITMKSSHQLEHAVLYAHELGHAVTFLKLMDKQDDIEKQKDYWHEQQAFAMESRFVNSLPPKERQLAQEKSLYYHLRAWFEYAIYSDTSQDLSDLYAKAHQTYYWGQQTHNPFYVLDPMFITFPCYSIIYAVLDLQEE
ncbi:hypothetical protein HGA91_05890 [candidate division WWE3 bacterium]|nr:hypothetical protein [candidate division WWE3 bacterium]